MEVSWLLAGSLFTLAALAIGRWRDSRKPRDRTLLWAALIAVATGGMAIAPVTPWLATVPLLVLLGLAWYLRRHQTSKPPGS